MPSYDDARGQWEDTFRQKSGRGPSDEDYNDFDMKWRKTPDFQQSEVARTGNPEAGYSSPASGQRDWGSLLWETGGDLDRRFSDAPPAQQQSPTQAWNSQPSGSGGGSRDALIAQLMARATQGPVDRNDLNIRAQVDPAVAQMERSSRGYLDDAAERAGPLANLQGERRLASERTGQAAGTLEGEVIGREIEGRRDEIMQSLSLWGDQLSDQERLALQRELGYLDDATRRYGIDSGADVSMYGLNLNNDQFLRDLALREYDTWNRWDPTNPINLP